VVEALGRGCEDAGLLFSACAHLFACVMPLVEHGSEAQKAALLPALCSGERIGANAITEAGAGSDVHAMKARAVPADGGGYLLTGEKSYVSNAPVADLFLAYAVTRPEHGYLGMSAFLVERECAGVTVGKPFHKLGLVGSPIASVYFDGCAVPEDRRLGADGQGATIFRSSMMWERACLFALYVGLMERTLERAVEHVRTRRQFKKPLGKHQAVAHRIADMKLRLESSRLLLYRACWSMDHTPDASRLDVALSKLAVSEAAVQSGLDAIHLFGGMGVVEETGIAAALRDAVPSTLFSGTSEIQKDLIARELGL
jgi:alkylation response protein AidB-like acyl-CoA dehydrogenase